MEGQQLAATTRVASVLVFISSPILLAFFALVLVASTRAAGGAAAPASERPPPAAASVGEQEFVGQQLAAAGSEGSPRLETLRRNPSHAPLCSERASASVRFGRSFLALAFRLLPLSFAIPVLLSCALERPVLVQLLLHTLCIFFLIFQCHRVLDAGLFVRQLIGAAAAVALSQPCRGRCAPDPAGEGAPPRGDGGAWVDERPTLNRQARHALDSRPRSEDHVESLLAVARATLPLPPAQLSRPHQLRSVTRIPPIAAFGKHTVGG